MAEHDRLLRLFTWLSPAFPIGGFAYSQGLETAIADGRIADAPTLVHWLEGQLHLGFIRADAYFLAIAARAVSSVDAQAFAETAELALALQVTAERHLETCEQARSFLFAAAAWPVETPPWLDAALSKPVALPIAFGALVSAHGIGTRAAVLGFINAAIGQQISVAVRLVPLGQTQGLAVQAQLEPRVTALADDAAVASLEDIGGIAYGSDIAGMRHEDLNVRIFRS
nr:urease accessory protein UreF [Pelagibacterium limicola]